MNTRTESYREALQVRYEAWLMKKETLSKALRYDFNTLVKTLDRHGLFKTLVAHNVTLWSFERESTDKSLYLFEICPSLSSESRAKLRALCLSALMERPIGLQYFSINDKSLKVLPPCDKKLAEDVLNYCLTQLQEAVLNITTIDKPSKKSNHSAQESQSIIWRGTDLENVEKRSRQVYDDFEKLLGSWNNESI